jgi:hypothetical protein
MSTPGSLCRDKLEHADAHATLPDVNDEHLKRIAELLRERNAVDAEIAAIMHRPMTSGHLGEWIASQVFDIELEPTATATAIDGRFRSGPLQSRTVNIKWYLKREGLLDMSEPDQLDYYLVLTGPPSGTVSSRGATRPWRIEAVFLFDARQLGAEQAERGVKRGIASSVLKRQWTTAEVYPAASSSPLTVTSRQAEMLRLFCP